LAALPSQSSNPPPQAEHAPLAQLWAVEHAVVAHVVPQLESRLRGFSHPLVPEPSHSSVPVGHATQAPPLHVWVFAAQGTAASHCPLDEQVCTPLPEHCLAPGTHTPVHALPTQADETQVDAVPHCPLDEQVCTPLLEHCFVPGVHTPVQAPPTHAWLEHVAPFCQVPAPSHVCTTSPTHCEEPGLHVPEQEPPLHTFVHTVPFTHAPFASHVCGVLLEHCLAPGAHAPVHTPLTHALFVQPAAAPHWPLAEQVCTPLPEH
jgi:hypothetical protein